MKKTRNKRILALSIVAMLMAGANPMAVHAANEVEIGKTDEVETGTTDKIEIGTTDEVEVAPAEPILSAEEKALISLGLDAKVTGWQKSNNKWYYVSKDKTLTKGWLLDKTDNNWYYLDSNGAMKIGWYKEGCAWYFLYGNGMMAKGWTKLGNTWYYMHDNGVMASGWQRLRYNGKWAWYYFSGNGDMYANRWVCSGGKWYYLRAGGDMADCQWIDGTYYVNSNGVMETNKWIWDQYWVDGSGRWIPNYQEYIGEVYVNNYHTSIYYNPFDYQRPVDEAGHSGWIPYSDWGYSFDWIGDHAYQGFDTTYNCRPGSKMYIVRNGVKETWECTYYGDFYADDSRLNWDKTLSQKEGTLITQTCLPGNIKDRVCKWKRIS